MAAIDIAVLAAFPHIQTIPNLDPAKLAIPRVKQCQATFQTREETWDGV